MLYRPDSLSCQTGVDNVSGVSLETDKPPPFSDSIIGGFKFYLQGLIRALVPDITSVGAYARLLESGSLEIQKTMATTISDHIPPSDKEHIEKGSLDALGAGSSSDEESFENPHGLSEKKVLRKLDWKLLPPLTLLYLLSFLDRSNGKFMEPHLTVVTNRLQSGMQDWKA